MFETHVHRQLRSKHTVRQAELISARLLLVCPYQVVVWAGMSVSSTALTCFSAPLVHFFALKKPVRGILE